MAYDSVRAQLDKLLGPERNGPLPSAATQPLSYHDASVCKGFLLGFCPNDLYIKHRSEPGSCPKKHPSTARDVFERDLRDGKAAADAARWRRDLAAECKAILDDEERRIRAHARRLQDMYAVTGSLNGLMIRDFDTLKKLGMVAQDAKIRILSEMDDVEEINVGGSGAGKQERKEAEENPSPLPATSATKDSSSSDDDPDDPDDDPAADADDDFGVISVIPAADSDPKDKQEAPVVGKDSHPPSADRPSTDKTEAASNPAAEEAPVKENGSPEKDSTKDENRSDQVAKTDKSNSKDQVDEVNGASTSSPSAIEDKMEEFYKKGTGPDGLLMLTRKQSLRVCACCGGFISLVDAESRLLSHYGGKSHHSLVQLREKVAELDQTIALDRRSGRETSPREYDRGRRPDSETNWLRGDERRPSHWDSRDRYGGRRERGSAYDRRGHSDRYSGSYQRRDDWGRAREPHSRHRSHYEDGRYHARYGNERKRYRSRSPTRSYRRQRHRH